MNVIGQLEFELITVVLQSSMIATRPQGLTHFVIQSKYIIRFFTKLCCIETLSKVNFFQQVSALSQYVVHQTGVGDEGIVSGQGYGLLYL